MGKVLAEINCRLEVAFGWCLSAKKALLNSYRYSPSQLAFGYYPNFLSVNDSKLSALKRETSSKLIASYLNALHSAKGRFIETETNENLRRALKQTKTVISFQYQAGDQVYYKKDDSQYWNGLGVRHGAYLRVNPCNLQHAKKTKEEVSQSKVIDNTNNTENKENGNSERGFEDYV